MAHIQKLKSTLTTPLTISIKPNEYWYGGAVMDGSQYPFTANDSYQRDFIHLETVNQATPALISTTGRAIWSEAPFSVKVNGDKLEIVTRYSVNLDDSGHNLKDAQQILAKNNFAFGQIPPKEFFSMPQWNDWIELLYNQNQADILKYAHGIVENGFPAGILMIDDLWADYYGNWHFSKNKFPDAKAMIAEIHALGFKVMAWVCPFVTSDTKEFHYLRDHHMLIEDAANQPVIRKWWNGYSAILDLSNPKTFKWLKTMLEKLQTETGVDGFKFDAGDPQFYDDNDRSNMSLSHQQQTEIWGEFGTHFKFNEFRTNYRNQGKALVNRLQDKAFDWGKDGLSELIPDSLTQGLLGYYFNCPDMIGGGEYKSFLSKDNLDQELIVRSAQCSALMPMMQFSVAPWRVLDSYHLDLCKQAAQLHTKMSPYIISLAENAGKTGEPITRPMQYDYPKTPISFAKTQFMLGTQLLVAPVIEKGATDKLIYFPSGQWQSLTNANEVVSGPVTKKIPVDLATLPAYKLLAK